MANLIINTGIAGASNYFNNIKIYILKMKNIIKHIWKKSIIRNLNHFKYL